jgi:hypothetical protein
VLDHLALHQLSHLVNDMDLVMMARHQYVVGNFLFRLQLLEDVVLQDAQQNQGEQNQVVHLPYLGEVHPFPVVVVVDVEPLHLLKMDCYQDVVGVEPHYLLKMDYCQGAEPLELMVLEPLELMVLEPQALPMQMQPLLHLAQSFQHREMP